MGKTLKYLSFKFSYYNFHLSFHLLTIFFQSFFFISLFFFLDSLNCKVAIQLILIWKVTFIHWCLLLCQSVEEELLILISNTILTFIANKFNVTATIAILISQLNFNSHPTSHQCLSPSGKFRSCLWMFGMKLAKLLFGCPTVNFGPVSRRQSHSHDVNHCILHIQSESHQEPRNKVGSLSPAKHLVGFESGTLQFWLQCLNPIGQKLLVT